MQTILFNKSTEQVYKKGNAAENQDFFMIFIFFSPFCVDKQTNNDRHKRFWGFIPIK